MMLWDLIGYLTHLFITSHFKFEWDFGRLLRLFGVSGWDIPVIRKFVSGILAGFLPDSPVYLSFQRVCVICLALFKYGNRILSRYLFFCWGKEREREEIRGDSFPSNDSVYYYIHYSSSDMKKEKETPHGRLQMGQIGQIGHRWRGWAQRGNFFLLLLNLFPSKSNKDATRSTKLALEKCKAGSLGVAVVSPPPPTPPTLPLCFHLVRQLLVVRPADVWNSLQ